MHKLEVRDQYEKARKGKDNIEIQTGVQLHKITNSNPIGDAIKTIIN